jgi:trehalose 6-phosphate synthase
MSRLIVVSNRIPTDEAPAGGLVFAIHEMLQRLGGLWVGAADPGETPEGVLTEIGSGAYQRATFPISAEEHAGYYLGYANSVLWPIFHSRRDLFTSSAGWFKAYAAVNARLAKLLAEQLQPDDLIWIQDYHFLPLATELRALGVQNRIGFFLHIPFPSPGDLDVIPQVQKLPGWLAAFDVVGLQAQRDVENCLDFLRRSGEIAVFPEGDRLGWRGRQFSVASFPIGIDASAMQSAAQEGYSEALRTLGSGQKIILGVDRLDYSKGLVQRVEAFGRLLDHPAHRARRPTYLQIAPASRENISAYGDIRAHLDQMAGSVNGTHAELDWTPIRYVRKNFPRDEIAGLYRRADIALVTPLADGMNLVAKEYVAAQDSADPGVLILSRFAGASEQLNGALLVNPYDPQEIADRLATAITMSAEERSERYAEMLPGVLERDIAWWGQTFLERLTGA